MKVAPSIPRGNISLRRVAAVLLCIAATALGTACGAGGAGAQTSTSSPSPYGTAVADPRLPEGTYSTGRRTREQLIRAGLVAGLTRGQIESALQQDGIDQVATFIIKLQAGRWTQLYDYGKGEGIGSSATYAVIDGSTVSITEACCGTSTFEYVLDRDGLHLRIADADPQKVCHDDVGCFMAFLVFESAPFIRTA